MLVPRKMSISPLESWLTAHYLLPRLAAGGPGTVAPAQLYECPPNQVGERAEQEIEGIWDAPRMQCKNVLKIRRRKMNHHKYRKLVKRTRFLRRKVREGRLKRKQVSVGLTSEGWARWLRMRGCATNQSVVPPCAFADQVRERPEAHLAEGRLEGSPCRLADSQDLPEGQMSLAPLPHPLLLVIPCNKRPQSAAVPRGPGSSPASCDLSQD